MELMNALLLSLPGTPIIYYGDEIGMGDNIYLGDRDGVRTPMQWSDDRNAGFSRANPQRSLLAGDHRCAVPLRLAQRRGRAEPAAHSMLWWMRRIVGLRKQYAALGRGSIEFLTPDNAKVLVYLRRHEEETLLIVANLSRYVQCAELDLSRFRGQVPVELFGQTQFPPIGELPYFLTLGPYAFYWFRLERGSQEAETLAVDLPSCKVSGQWDALFEGKPRTRLEAALPAYLKRNRWFAGKARPIQQAKLVDVLRVDEVPELEGGERGTGRSRSGDAATTRMLIVRIEYLEGEPENYVLPVLFAQGDQEQNILGDRPGAGIIAITRSDDGQHATLCDTTHEHEFWQSLFAAIAGGHRIAGSKGHVEPLRTDALARLGTDLSGDASIHGGEQSNTSAVVGGKFILKMFRRIGEGENPDLEIGKYLTEKTDLACVPPLAGGLEYYDRDGDRYSVAVLHEYVANEGDAWVYTLDELGRYVERVHSEITGPPSDEALPPTPSLLELTKQPIPDAAQHAIGSYLQTAELLGRRTADMHLALAAGEDKSFAAEPFSRLYQRSLYQSMRASARRVLSLLRKRRGQLPEAATAQAELLLKNEELLLERFHRISDIRISAQRTRCHGDFHLGQVLFTGKDFIITDFEGEPERPIGERRIKVSPLRDAAGMIRSFHYASHAAMSGARRESWLPSAQSSEAASWLAVWYLWSAASYLKAYLAHASSGEFLPARPEELEALLNGYILEKAVYELGYELNNRPGWVPIPLEGILHSLQLNVAGEHAPS
jgi:maltose alpha-D-glucosyltransferase / alpha-amylase